MKKHAFTLIEVIVVISITALMLTVLAVAMNVSMRIWKKSERMVWKNIEVENALARFEKDLKRIIPNSVRTLKGDALHISFPALCFNEVQDNLQMKAYIVEYKFNVDSKIFTRQLLDFVSLTPLTIPLRILDNIDKIEIYYGAKCTSDREMLQWASEWNCPTTFPDAVRICIQLSSTRIVNTIPVYGGMFHNLEVTEK